MISRVNTVTEEAALDAICIWEYALELRRQGDASFQEWLADDEGVANARQNCLVLADFFGKVWELAVEKGFCDSFDWELIPDVADILVGRFARPADVRLADAPGVTEQVMFARSQARDAPAN